MRLVLPMYTIQDLELFSPLGEWLLCNSQGEVLARFYNGAMVNHAVIQGNSDETRSVA